MFLERNEINYLRDLAAEVKNISEDPIWEEKRDFWKRKNALKKTRPAVLCSLPNASWDEIIPQNSLRISDPMFRDFERRMRMTIYRYKNLKDDFILNNKLYLPIDYTVRDWFPEREKPYSSDASRSAAFHPVIIDYSDFEKIQKPEITDINWDSTNKKAEIAREVLGDYMDIEVGLPYYGCLDSKVFGFGASMIDVFCELRGLENIMLDLAIEPEWCHEVMEYMTKCYEEWIDQLQENKLLRLNNNEFVDVADTPLHSNGLACTDELPPEGYDPNNITTKDLWGYAQAQELTLVSPDMLEEFVLPYQGRIAERFGMNVYGCCECMDKKLEIIKKYIPRLREISITFSCDLEIAADSLKSDYVYSWKPNTAELITLFSPERIRKHMGDGFKIMKDCNVVASLRDTQTLYGEPQRASTWCDVTMELAREYE